MREFKVHGIYFNIIDNENNNVFKYDLIYFNEDLSRWIKIKSLKKISGVKDYVQDVFNSNGDIYQL